ncbi:MAG: nucleotidyl transferase AbiEii/AbiGii toxin family protein [Ruminococcus sp.]|uniref:nucleotidyl transferase AbiEii/AbiGii toxin family protein n=1 Tax=Ruminococcus sp. TaxID=41978 RepID=UPI0025E254C0|nr:nucleotidyl transferase AbiEii/AbiGii toxin family protein [Ruminococcus sp.]MCR4794008.1 nucleotidyl transferase AbiEii/AbiGii toxin family protein [Ruminococcus sp.]
MNSVLGEMLKKYETHGISDKKNAIKEIMQEIVLCGLSRAGFFKKTAFYGGTALRKFYGLDRFSEDLDFSLMETDDSFDLSEYFPILRKEIASYGLNVEVSEKQKTKESAIRSAFLKGNTKEHMLLFYASDPVISSVAGDEKIKIKFEVDTNPPIGATFERKYRLLPSPYEVTLYDMPSLFAGKAHAVICRSWKSRVKGRDLYDYIFYLSRGAALNTEHLKARLVQSDAWKQENDFNIDDAKILLCSRFDTIDFEQAKDDVRPFIKDTGSLDLWCADFFKQITNDLK